MSATVSTKKKSRAAFWLLVVVAIVVSIALNALIVSENYLQVAMNTETPHAGGAGMLLVLPFFGAVLISIPLGLVLLFFRTTRRCGAALLVVSVVFVGGSRIAVYEGNRIRMEAFRELAERSMVLVEAVKAFEQAENRLPATLQELVPRYLPEVPMTGMATYPSYDLLTGEDAEMWFDNPWVLRVHTGRGGINFDEFLYFPLQNYPNKVGGDRFERLGAWAYLHE